MDAGSTSIDRTRHSSFRRRPGRRRRAVGIVGVVRHLRGPLAVPSGRCRERTPALQILAPQAWLRPPRHRWWCLALAGIDKSLLVGACRIFCNFWSCNALCFTSLHEMDGV